MLSINETMNSIIRKLSTHKKAHRDIFEVSRSPNRLVLGASCIEQDRTFLARVLIERIRKMNLMNKPKIIEFSTDCDIIECRIICTW